MEISYPDIRSGFVDNILMSWFPVSDTYLKPSQTSMMEVFFAKITCCQKPVTIFVKAP